MAWLTSLLQNGALQLYFPAKSSFGLFQCQCSQCQEMSGTRHWELNLLSEAFPKCHFRKLSKPCNLASEGRLGNGAHPSQSQDFQPVNNVSLILFIMLGFSIFLLGQRNIIEIINITIAYHLSNASKLRSYGWTCNSTFCYY